MTALDRLFSYFPLLLTAAAFTAAAMLAAWPSGWTVALFLFVIYLVAPVILRVMQIWAPIKHGASAIDGRKFSPWLASHHVQAFYDALPFLEALLRVIPGFYSMWLRIWGSRIGYGVEWAVNMSVFDRSLIDIGNRVVFSRSVELASHVRRKTDTAGSRVLVRPVRIGGYAFLGAGAQLGPGVNVPVNAQVPALAVLHANETFGEGVRHPNPDEAEFAAS